MKKLKNKIMNDTNIIPYINITDRLKLYAISAFL